MIEHQRDRYSAAIAAFGERFGADGEISVYSVPGRVELCGNHTDHNGGRVLAAAVNLDAIAVVSKSEGGSATVLSRGFDGEYVVPLSELSPRKEEAGTSSAMIRGVAAGIAERGGRVGGFNAYVESDVIKGSGLSSSAAFEVCIGAILNGEYNSDRFGPLEIGMIGQYAENEFFGKPCGLMDQVACAAGGAISVDFRDQTNPIMKEVPFDLSSFGLKLVVTDTKGDHANLTDEYASIRREMEDVARFLGHPNLGAANAEDFYERLADARAAAGDRAVLRALHFFEECRRVDEVISAIERGDRSGFLDLIVECGHSSFEYNQNAYCGSSPRRQEVSVGLALSQTVLNGRGAWRLQGGGFAGTIQGYVPDDLLDSYCSFMRGVFGDDACHVLRVRAPGPINVTARMGGD
jgi:galactokinase